MLVGNGPSQGSKFVKLTHKLKQNAIVIAQAE
jgi:hypothetical protein